MTRNSGKSVIFLQWPWSLKTSNKHRFCEFGCRQDRARFEPRMGDKIHKILSPENCGNGHAKGKLSFLVELPKGHIFIFCITVKAVIEKKMPGQPPWSRFYLRFRWRLSNRPPSKAFQVIYSCWNALQYFYFSLMQYAECDICSIKCWNLLAAAPYQAGADSPVEVGEWISKLNSNQDGISLAKGWLATSLFCGRRDFAFIPILLVSAPETKGGIILLFWGWKFF